MEILRSEENCDPNVVENDQNKINSNNPAMFQEQVLIELGKSSWYPAPENIDKQTYLRGCKWSPDGTCCLTVVNNGGMHLLELPLDLYNVEEINSDRPINILESTLKVPECGLVYDFCWFPGMNSTVPETCCWMTTRQHSPIQLWDAYDGSLRCSYKGFNHVDELEPALSVCFSADGTQIHAGYKKSLKTFDVNRPGREYVDQKICSSASCLSVSPASDSLIAVGAWSSEISLYDIHQGNTKSLAKLRFHSGGVTHLAFLADGSKLISGARKDSDLLLWDLRFYKRPFRVLKREVKTNQRIYFDVSNCGRYLASGGTNGVVNVWDLSTDMITDEGCSYSNTMYPLHNDCCNGVSIHPYRPILATSSGQHHIPVSDYLSEETQNNEDNPSTDSVSPHDEKMECDSLNIIIENTINCSKNQILAENTLEFWWTGKVKRDD